MGHPIQNRTAQPTFDFLDGQSARPQFVADDLFIAKHLRLGQRASVIAALVFPAFSALFADAAQNPIPRQRRGVTVPMLLNLGIFAQGNDGFDACSCCKLVAGRAPAGAWRERVRRAGSTTHTLLGQLKDFMNSVSVLR